MISSTVISCAYCAESLARVCDWTEMQDGHGKVEREEDETHEVGHSGTSGARLVAEMDLDWSIELDL